MEKHCRAEQSKTWGGKRGIPGRPLPASEHPRSRFSTPSAHTVALRTLFHRRFVAAAGRFSEGPDMDAKSYSLRPERGAARPTLLLHGSVSGCSESGLTRRERRASPVPSRFSGRPDVAGAQCLPSRPSKKGRAVSTRPSKTGRPALCRVALRPSNMVTQGRLAPARSRRSRFPEQPGPAGAGGGGRCRHAPSLSLFPRHLTPSPSQVRHCLPQSPLRT